MVIDCLCDYWHAVLAWKFLSRSDVCLRQVMLPAVVMSLTLMMFCSAKWSPQTLHHCSKHCCYIISALADTSLVHSTNITYICLLTFICCVWIKEIHAVLAWKFFHAVKFAFGEWNCCAMKYCLGQYEIFATQMWLWQGCALHFKDFSQSRND